MELHFSKVIAKQNQSPKSNPYICIVIIHASLTLCAVRWGYCSGLNCPGACPWGGSPSPGEHCESLEVRLGSNLVWRVRGVISGSGDLSIQHTSHQRVLSACCIQARCRHMASLSSLILMSEVLLSPHGTGGRCCDEGMGEGGHTQDCGAGPEPKGGGKGAAQGDRSRHPHPFSCLPAKERHVPRMFAGFIPPGHLPRFL